MLDLFEKLIAHKLVPILDNISAASLPHTVMSNV